MKKRLEINYEFFQPDLQLVLKVDVMVEVVPKLVVIVASLVVVDDNKVDVDSFSLSVSVLNISFALSAMSASSMK